MTVTAQAGQNRGYHPGQTERLCAHADVAELADATDLGSVALRGVEVRVLSSAHNTFTGPWPSGKASPLQGEDRRFESDRVHKCSKNKE